MSDQTATAPTEVLPAIPDGPALPAGVVASPNYGQAIEVGKVLAASGLYPEYRDAAKAAVAVMIGLDLGISPTQAIMNIHAFEESGGKISFVIESKVMASLIKQHPRYDYKIIERKAEVCTLQFTVDGEPIDDGEEGKITYTIEDATRAGLAGPNAKKKAWKTNPRDMLHWRVIAEGVRVYFPELLSGQPVYADVEIPAAGDGAEDLMQRLEPPKQQPLTDEKAKALEKRMETAHLALQEINPTRVPPGMYANMLERAQHSHTLLEGRALHLEDLLAKERRLVEVTKQLDESTYSATERKQIIERADRRSATHERIEVIEQALAAAPQPEAEAKSEGGQDAPAE